MCIIYIYMYTDANTRSYICHIVSQHDGVGRLYGRNSFRVPNNMEYRFETQWVGGAVRTNPTVVALTARTNDSREQQKYHWTGLTGTLVIFLTGLHETYYIYMYIHIYNIHTRAILSYRPDSVRRLVYRTGCRVPIGCWFFCFIFFFFPNDLRRIWVHMCVRRLRWVRCRIVEAFTESTTEQTEKGVLKIAFKFFWKNKK